MKLIRIAALLLILLLAFTACESKGSNSSAPPAPASQAETKPAATEAKTEPVTTETEPVTTEAETEPVTTEAETEPVTTEAETEPVITEAETEPAEPAEKEFHVGKVEGSVYTNEYLDLRCEAPEGWMFYDEEQIAMINNISSSLVKDEDIAEAVKQNGQYTDMYMSDFSTNVNLVIQPMNPMMKMFSDEELFELSKGTVEEQLKAAGFDLKSIDQIDVQFRGETVRCLQMVIVMYGVQLEEYQLWIRPEGEYFGILTVATQDGSDVQDVLDCFSRLNG